MSLNVKQSSNPKVDSFLDRTERWSDELALLRRMALDCELVEELKWGKPCYTLQQNNIVILQGFKDFCAILFPKGALLKDPRSVLEKPGENTQSARRIPFTKAEDIADMEAVIKAYIHEAVEVERAGLKVDFKTMEDYVIPEELQAKLDEIPAFKEAFNALTPGRQRGYLLHFSEPKQSKTRASRVARHMQQIMDGKGLNDR
ncbi:YdeI/OmpD-associated family protein [Hahella sp. CR1]|uniref:YdeI/OmpD-associated family protein n=1 Tax=Hahella sp. CR1 TaxID=2992807 RepID=UPI002442ACE8|nr:YdeI/OmpD-associated family protein [Hahella sp. CR1]MDG9667737.1 YdeI/OmpD-associated family protein [Hahella sp. CR1]